MPIAKKVALRARPRSVAKKQAVKASDGGAPLMGALLRVAHEALVAHILRKASAAGFDISQTEFGVFRYPGPQGLRPIDLARRLDLSKQAMNYILANLTARGYLEPRPDSGPRFAGIEVSARGYALVALLREGVLEVEGEWTAVLGKTRMAQLRSLLTQLDTHLGNLEPSYRRAAARRIAA